MGLKELFTDIEISLIVGPDTASSKSHNHAQKGALTQNLPLPLVFSSPDSLYAHTGLQNQRQDLSVNQTAVASNPSPATAFLVLSKLHNNTEA